MPQLDFGNPLMIAQIVWLLIIFGVLYYVLATYALPRVEAVLEDRRRRIEGDLDRASGRDKQGTGGSPVGHRRRHAIGAA